MVAQAAFLACGLIFLGIIFATAGVISLGPALGSTRWPAAPGEVLSAKIASRDGRPHPLVRYTYQVGGKAYTAARISFHSTTSLPLPGLPAETAEAVLARYPAGKSMPVYYDPAAPDRAVLEPGAGPGAYLPAAVGGLFFILGLLAGIFAFL
jgi:hypothetical protein